MTKIRFLLLLIFIFLSQKTEAQAGPSSDLYKTILAKDSLLFSIGFNTCDIKQYENLLSENLKFYHDKDGISDKAKFLNDLKNGLCKNPEIRQVKRTLVKRSTEIFPLYKNEILYGAVQHGAHIFNEAPGSEQGFARFSNVWELENGDWKLTTSLSFGHRPYSPQQTEISIFDNNIAIESWLKENNIKTLGLGIIEEGKLKQVKVFGEIKNGISAPYNTIFNVASLTKPVTAMVALQLINSGQWNLDEPLYKYWTDPDILKDPRNKKLTTRLILSHQTGFRNWRWQTENKKLKFEFDPGTKYQYSGEGFEYLRKALEDKFKKPLEQLAAELVFRPLNMSNTDYVWSKNTAESRFAIGYDKAGKPYEIVKNKTANAADDLHTTIEDYGNFLVNILNGGGLTENVYQEMFKKQVKTKENKYFGLGFEIYDLGKGDFAISHGGSDSGTQCITFLLPKTKQGILIFTNSDTGYKVYEKLLTHYLGENGKKLIEIETK
ncbi:serine hydrolase [Chryseobacterium elymi]|uniref:Serine hydrolase n=1 Tax=Chryseobacterium elymi TaxID=395936 RepID=A0A3D9DCT4_9FLAO|nr:serine hydrolase [Chryseobacterium elymi]REC75837.1 serine hydrolase [Chryseobacterium elymi]